MRGRWGEQCFDLCVGAARVLVTSVQASVLSAAGVVPFHHGQCGLSHCMPGPAQSPCGHGCSGWASQIHPLLQ